MKAILRVKIAGREYEIPESWLMGFMARGGRTVHEAALHWHEQATMAERNGKQ